MACGSCGHKRKDIKIDQNRSANNIQLRRMGANLKIKSCPICKSPMRGLHVHDKEIGKLRKVFYCTNKNCKNSRSK